MAIVFDLEARLRLLSEGHENAQELLTRYEATKTYLTQAYYPWIQANCPYFTDHGIGHVKSVMAAAAGMLGDSAEELDDLEIFLLMSAILLHDVGNVITRVGHAEQAVINGILSHIRPISLPDVQSQRIVAELVKAHSGTDGLRAARPREETSLGDRTYTIHTRALAAVLRFADEISENKTRISADLLPTVPEKNAVYWHFANAVQSSRPDPARRRVVISIELDAAEAIRRFACPPECASHQDADGKIALVEYIVHRLEKANNERIYCHASFSRYCQFDDIEAHFTLTNDGERIDSYDDKSIVLGDGGLTGAAPYPAVSLYDDFFEKNPDLCPASIEGVV